MSNTNTNMQTQTSNALHNAIMEASGKDRPPMLAHDQLNAEAEAIQIILIGIDNDIYSTVDACPNACEMWKAIERLKQGVVNALAARDADKSRNGEDIQDSGTGVRRQTPLAREYTYLDFMKCKSLELKGTEGVIELTQ
ncbi:hypothetical protein Tco_0824933 [Tanacetum coccineum]